jgi:hypothetical protein
VKILSISLLLNTIQHNGLEKHRHFECYTSIFAHAQLGWKRGKPRGIEGSERDKQEPRRIEKWTDEHNLNTAINTATTAVLRFCHFMEDGFAPVGLLRIRVTEFYIL